MVYIFGDLCGLSESNERAREKDQVFGGSSLTPEEAQVKPPFSSDSETGLTEYLQLKFMLKFQESTCVVDDCLAQFSRIMLDGQFPFYFC